jgi:anti-sigma B factor antagonist
VLLVEWSRKDQPQPRRTEVIQEMLDSGVALQVIGELDLATVGELEESVERALARASAPLVIDLTDCGFIDSSVLNMLAKLRRRLDGSVPHPLAVVARDQPLEVLRLTRLDDEVPVFPSLGEALSALQVAAVAES